MQGESEPSSVENEEAGLDAASQDDGPSDNQQKPGDTISDQDIEENVDLLKAQHSKIVKDSQDFDPTPSPHGSPLPRNTSSLPPQSGQRTMSQAKQHPPHAESSGGVDEHPEDAEFEDVDRPEDENSEPRRSAPRLQTPSQTRPEQRHLQANTRGETVEQRPLGSYDWDELYGRFQSEMTKISEHEGDLELEWQKLMTFRHIWAQQGPAYDEGRATKRLKTLVSKVQQEEIGLDKKRGHHQRVVAAFQNALSLLEDR